MCSCSMAAELVRLADSSQSSASSGVLPAAPPGADAAAGAHVLGVPGPVLPSSGSLAGGAGAGGAPVDSMQVR